VILPKIAKILLKNKKSPKLSPFGEEKSHFFYTLNIS